MRYTPVAEDIAALIRQHCGNIFVSAGTCTGIIYGQALPRFRHRGVYGSAEAAASGIPESQLPFISRICGNIIEVFRFSADGGRNKEHRVRIKVKSRTGSPKIVCLRSTHAAAAVDGAHLKGRILIGRTKPPYALTRSA